MSRRLTAADRSALIRLASTLPVGDETRRAILNGLGRVAMSHIPDDAPDWIKNAKPSSRKYTVKMHGRHGYLEFDITPSEAKELKEAMDEAIRSNPEDWDPRGDTYSPWIYMSAKNRKITLEFEPQGSGWEMLSSPDGYSVDLKGFTQNPDRSFKDVIEDNLQFIRATHR